MKNKLIYFLTFLVTLSLAAISTKSVAAVTTRYVEDGNIRVRFYFDKKFYDNHLDQYNNLISDLVNAMRYTGRYRLGIKFTHESQTNNVVDIGNISDSEELLEFMQDNIGTQGGVLKVLIHHNLIGVCEPNYYSYAVGTYYWNTNLMWITTNPGCSSSGRIPQAEVKETFIHELGHAVWHQGLWGSACAGSRNPIMCHSGLANRDWTHWRASDIRTIREGVFGGTKPSWPVVSCYEYSGYSACSNDCAVWQCTFNYNDPLTYESCYNSCLTTRCNKICN